MNIQENIRVLEEEILKLSVEKMTPSLAQNLNTYFGAKNALETLLTNQITKKTIKPIQNTYNKYLPSINEYMIEHNEHNLKKVCLEIQEVCASIYGTLQSEEEKIIYFNMIKNI